MKLPHLENVQRFTVSRPARALWIEIRGNWLHLYRYGVEAREGLVD